MLAEDDEEMISFLRNHLIDVQNTGPNKMPWKFNGAWKINGEFQLLLYQIFKITHSLTNKQILLIPDSDKNGFDIFDDLPEENEVTQKQVKPEATTQSLILEKIEKMPKRKSPLRRRSKQKDVVDSKIDADIQSNETNNDSDTEIFEIEESDTPLLPLYHLRDEGSTKWVLLSDLCYLLKIKSKDTLLKSVIYIIFYSSSEWNTFHLNK